MVLRMCLKHERVTNAPHNFLLDTKRWHVVQLQRIYYFFKIKGMILLL